METQLIENEPIILQKKSCTVKYLLYGFIIIFSIREFGILYSDRWKNHKSLIYEILHKHILNRSIVAENVKADHHKLLIWVAAYDLLHQRDRYVLHHLTMAKNICETPSHNSFVRLFVATCSPSWNTSLYLREFKNRNSKSITSMTNTNTNSSYDFIIIEHFSWSCVEFIIGFYKTDLKLALPFQHRKYFREHVNEFDWFWFVEEDLLIYDSRTYWKLIKDTLFALNTLSSNQTNDLLSLYAHKGKKPKISTFGRYFLLPTLMRFEKPSNDQNNSTMQFTDHWDHWRLTEMGLCCPPVIEAIIFFNKQWWLQPTNSHSAYYLLPRTHLHVIVTDKDWLSESDIGNREWVSSFWLLDFGYIRVASITNFDQYLVHHASNKYYDHPYNLPKISTIIRGLGFEYNNGHFVPSMSLDNLQILNYTDDHNHDIASCFPLSFSPIPERPHEATPKCPKLLNMKKTNLMNREIA